LNGIEVRPALREIACDGRKETIDRRVMQVLVALVRAKGKVVSRDDLIESCWDGMIVGEDAINNCISRLRKAAEASGNAFSIETVPRVGYRLKVLDIATPGVDPRPADGSGAAAVTRARSASAAPQRPIYRGLQSLDEQDAEIFFGRDALIAEGIDALGRMRDGSAKSMLVILGASGAGKSSFLKAGLLARLKRDEENFLVLPVIRPERAALTGARGLAASLSCDPASLNGPQDIADIFARLRAPVVERFQRIAEDGGDSCAARPPTIVIPIDQAEELFAAENTEAGRVFELLADAVRADSDTIIVATIRSDAFEKLQSEPQLAHVQLLPFSLAPLPHGAFKEVIEGPARLASPKLTIEPALTERLLRDLEAGDALPLLAFTLERLWMRHRGGGILTLAEYVDDLGGLQGAITGAVEAAFAQTQRDPGMPHERVELERLARAVFIPSLVQLDDADGEPRRRVERLNALPEATLPLVRQLVDQRLLVSDRGTADGVVTDTVEVAHEAILRQWRTLRVWIAEERDALRALDGTRSAAAEWYKHNDSKYAERSKSWLTHHGGRLEEAEALITRPGFANALNSGEIEYLAACRAKENAERLQDKREIARTRRLQRNVGIVIAVAAAVLVLAAMGILQLLAGTNARTSSTLASLRTARRDLIHTVCSRRARRAISQPIHRRPAGILRAGLVRPTSQIWSTIGPIHEE
jgi:DNA-binding winged helix-turn-helix (wHTH) protein